MALSTFLRAPACLGPVLRQSLARIVAQPSSIQRLVSTNVPAATTLFKDVKTTPITDAVRSLQTSAPALSFAKDEHAHDHARLWVIERAVSGLLVPLIPAALIYPNMILDCAMAILITVHSFWGLEACVVEYLRTLVVGFVIPKIAMAIVYSLTALQLGGLFYLTFNGGGLARSFWKIWLNLACPPEKCGPGGTNEFPKRIGLVDPHCKEEDKIKAKEVFEPCPKKK